MAHLIDKDALIAEIRRIMAEEMSFFKDCCKDELENTSSPAVYTRMEMLLSFLDTLEVKEVDLDMEINLWVKNLHRVPNFEELNKFARHFFELGLKAKGE